MWTTSAITGEAARFNRLVHVAPKTVARAMELPSVVIGAVSHPFGRAPRGVETDLSLGNSLKLACEAWRDEWATDAANSAGPVAKQRGTGDRVTNATTGR